MNIINPRGESLQQILPLLQARYPKAIIKKILFFSDAIVVPQDNFKFVVRAKKTILKLDNTLPVLWALGAVVVSILIVSTIMSLIYGKLVFGIGGAVWVILGVFIMKYFFRRVKKEQFDAFKNDLTDAVNGFDFEQSTAAHS